MIRKLFIYSALAASLCATVAQARPMDILGGREGTAQTITHCGLLPMTAQRYATSPITTRLVQQKLSRLGYPAAPTTGIYDRRAAQATRSFQRDYGLKTDGVVGASTAQRLAYETHPSRHVRRCFRMAYLQN